MSFLVACVSVCPASQRALLHLVKSEHEGPWRGTRACTWIMYALAMRVFLITITYYVDDSMYHYLFEVTQPVITLLIDLFSEYLMNDLIGFYNMN